MIQANELRLGNYVYPFDDLHLCSEDEIFANYREVYIEDFQYAIDIYPIPITEEWLLKLGGVDFGYQIKIKAKRKLLVFNWSFKAVSSGQRFGWYCKQYKHIKYIHQLQNLYFALTNKELVIK